MDTIKIYSIEFYDDDNCQLFISYDFMSKTRACIVYEFMKKYNPEKTKNIRLRIRILGPVKDSSIIKAIQRDAKSNDEEYIGTTYDDEDTITSLTIYHIDDDDFSHTEVLKFKLPEYIALCIDKLTLTFDSTEYTTCVEIE
jgi:hypothetical protein